VNRVKTGALLAIAAATIGSGCTTFSDNDLVARVDSDELSTDDLVELIGSDGSGDIADDANIARQAITGWISERLPALPDVGQAPTLYPQGYLVAGSTCIQLLVAADVAAAAETVEQLAAGDDYSAVFEERNIDPTGTPATTCLARGVLVPNSGNPLIDTALELTAGQPHAFVELDPGDGVLLPVVMRFTPYEELGPDETQVVFENLPPDLSGIDIYVDPRYGSFDEAGVGVVALG